MGQYKIVKVVGEWVDIPNPLDKSKIIKAVKSKEEVVSTYNSRRIAKKTTRNLNKYTNGVFFFEKIKKEK